METQDSGAVLARGLQSKDYPRLLFQAPYFWMRSVSEAIGPALLESLEQLLPGALADTTAVQEAVDAAVSQLAVLRAGDTMTGPLFTTELLPSSPNQLVTQAYVDMAMADTIPEVPIVPVGQLWARALGEWVPVEESGGGGGGDVTFPIAIALGGTGQTTAAAALAALGGIGDAPSNGTTYGRLNGAWAAVPPGGGSGGGIPEPTTAGNWLRTNAGTWVAGLPLAGGVTMTGLYLLSGNATQTMHPVPLGQLTSTLAGYVTTAQLNTAISGVAVGVTNVATGTGLTGGPIIGTGTIALANTAVAPGTYQGITIDQQGRVTAAANQGYTTNAGTVTSITAGTGLSGGTITGTGTIALANTAVTAGTYQGLTIDAQGRVTAAANQNYATVSALASYLPLAGGVTMTGQYNLSANATANLNPVPLQQMNTALSGYLPLTGSSAVTGSISSTATAASGYGSTTDGGFWAWRIDNTTAPGGYGPWLAFTRHKGTAAAPTALLNGDEIGSVQWNGRWSATQVTTTAPSFITANAVGNWSATNQATRLRLRVTEQNTLTPRELVFSTLPPAGLLLDFGNSQLVMYADTGDIGMLPRGSTALATWWTGTTGDVWFGGNIGAPNFPSDIRLKKHVAPYDKGLDVISKLQPCQWQWNGKGGTTDDGTWHYGVMADELQILAPEAVLERERLWGPGENERMVIKGIEDKVVIAMLVNAVRELRDLIEARGGTSGR